VKKRKGEVLLRNCVFGRRGSRFGETARKRRTKKKFTRLKAKGRAKEKKIGSSGRFYEEGNFRKGERDWSYVSVEGSKKKKGVERKGKREELPSPPKSARKPTDERCDFWGQQEEREEG